MANYSQQIIYNATHTLNAHSTSGVHQQKLLNVKITKTAPHLQIQVSDCNDYLFNYTANIDRHVFDQMKLDQSLDISYEEISGQILDLLQHTATKDMLIRLEYGEHYCKLIFYEKIRIKSLIFLTIEMQLTNQREIINEMSQHIKQLKDSNKNMASQLSTSKNEIAERDVMLKSALKTQRNMESQFSKNLQSVEKTFNASANTLANHVTTKLTTLSKRHITLARNLETVKRENALKCEANVRLVNSMQNLRSEHERNYKLIDELKAQVNKLNGARVNAERTNHEFQYANERLQAENQDLSKKVAELHKDLQEATIIITQKSKTHDELAKDLVQANSMLVNFTNHYDSLSKELNSTKATLTQKEQDLDYQLHQYRDLQKNFETYKKDFNYEDLEKMKQQVFLTSKQSEEVEKKNREIVKINALLSRKLASGDTVDVASVNSNLIKNHPPWMPRNN